MKTFALLPALMSAISQLHVASGTTTKFNATAWHLCSPQMYRVRWSSTQFDTLPALPVEGRLSPVGTYMGLSYPNFDLHSTVGEVAGLLAQSGTVDIFGAGSSNSPAAVTTSYPGSEVTSFALESFYYGCESNLDQGAAELPVKCTLKATGYRGGAVVATQEFSFTPENDVLAPLAFGRFISDFKNLQNVTFAQSPSTLTEFLLDTIVGSTQSWR